MVPPNSDEAIFARVGAGTTALSRRKEAGLSKVNADFEEVYRIVTTYGDKLSIDAVLTVGRVAHFFNTKVGSYCKARELSDNAIQRFRQEGTQRLNLQAGVCFLENAASKATLNEDDADEPLKEAYGFFSAISSRNPWKKRLYNVRYRLRKKNATTIFGESLLKQKEE